TDVGLGKALPACRLKYTRHRRPQERFRTGPSDLDLGNVEQIRIAACRKKRAVEITLNRLGPAIAEHMNPLRERLLDVFARGMIELAQPCMPGFDLNHSTASTCSLALKHRDQHSWRTHFHAATVASSPRTRAIAPAAASSRNGGIARASVWSYAVQPQQARDRDSQNPD